MSEWVLATFPGENYRIRARVGSTPKDLVDAIGAERAGAIYKPFLRWVDAIVFREREVILIEAKLRAAPGAIAQLKFYSDAFGRTEEFRAYWARPRRLLLLTPWLDPDTEAYAQREGVEVVRSVPDWLGEYLAKIQGYGSRAYQERKQRAEGLDFPPEEP